MSSISKSWSFILAIAGFLYGCSNEFEVDLPDYQPKLVIDGSIELGGYPVVYLTLSSGYYDPVDSASLIDIIVPTAKVAISDGEQEEVLTLFRNTEVYPPFFYRATKLRGEVGKTYTLEVTSKGEVYSASTIIPKPLDLDSVWFEYLEDSDSLGRLWIAFEDDPLTTDYYRTFTKIENKQSRFVPIYQSVVGDSFFDRNDIEFFVLKGSETFTEVTDDLYFSKGDSISIKFCTIDEQSFNFWRTLEREQYLTGNPFGSAGNPILSNISGTAPALGVWAGYGVSRSYFIVK
ncbi:MAG: hypothetical protein ACI83W_000889 [Marinoscillum sp.]|jgi:hypothetical protein